MKIVLIVGFIIVIGILIYFLIAASDAYSREASKNKLLTDKNISLEHTVEVYKEYKGDLERYVSAALVNLNSMGMLDGENKVQHAAAQINLMEANKIIEGL